MDVLNSSEAPGAEAFTAPAEEPGKGKPAPPTAREVEYLMEKIKELEKKVKSLDEEQK
jgi:hypothetical protein